MDFVLTVPLADTWGMDGNFGWGWMTLMMVVMVLFWAAVILGIVWLVRGGFEGWRSERKETPADILERRFAEGAISVEDYRERKAIIENGAGPKEKITAGSS